MSNHFITYKITVEWMDGGGGGGDDDDDDDDK
jgi:hypothetical protein